MKKFPKEPQYQTFHDDNKKIGLRIKTKLSLARLQQFSYRKRTFISDNKLMNS